jgi:hypothetical protein
MSLVDDIHRLELLGSSRLTSCRMVLVKVLWSKRILCNGEDKAHGSQLNKDSYKIGRAYKLLKISICKSFDGLSL